ncbi:hypothetical protein BH09MYX1_BH09MYX1_55320 [soil metagenome]
MIRAMRALGVASLVATTIVVAAACGGSDPIITTTQCVPHEAKACTGLGPCKGQQVCASDGTFGACVCGDASVIEAGQPDAVADAIVDVVVDQGVDGDAKLDVGVDAPPFDAGVFDGGPTHWGRALSADAISYGVVVDANQNIIIGGRFTAFGAGLTKLNAKGAPQWQKAISVVQQVAVDSTGAVYAAGAKDSTSIDFGNGSVVAPGAFLVKYDANGVFQWLYGPFANVLFYDVAVKSNGNVVVVGEFASTADFGVGGVSPVASRDATLIELTSSKTYVRQKQYGVDGAALFKSIAIDSSDNMFVAGSFDGSSITFGGPSIPSPPPGGSLDIFVVKLNANAGYVTQNDGHAIYNDYIMDMALDPSGRPYLTGALGTKIQFGSTPLIPFGGGGNVFISLLDASLNEVWSKRFGQVGGAYGIAADPGGGAVITGTTQGQLYFGLPGMPTVDGAYVARFDAAGNVVSNVGLTVQGGGGVTGFGIAHVTGSDFVLVGNCGGGLLGLPSGPLPCSFTSTGSGFATRFAP